jgi:hypothetical protein
MLPLRPRHEVRASSVEWAVIPVMTSPPTAADTVVARPALSVACSRKAGVTERLASYERSRRCPIMHIRPLQSPLPPRNARVVRTTCASRVGRRRRHSCSAAQDQVAVSMSNHRIKLYRPRESGLEYERDLQGHSNTISDLQYALPDAPHALHSCAADGTVLGWDTRVGKQVCSPALLWKTPATLPQQTLAPAEAGAVR